MKTSPTKGCINDFITQYGPLSIKYTDEFHDSFLILDGKERYHIGASIKDAGKKAFAITTYEDDRILESSLERLRKRRPTVGETGRPSDLS